MEYWQHFHDTPSPARPWQTFYDAPMPDGRHLRLPLRDMGATAVAGLIVNQASFTVTDRLAAWLARSVAPWQPDLVVALPTLGHITGSTLARALGHPNWAALGTARKLWYDETLSTPLASITTPGPGRRLWLDPRLLPRLKNRRLLLVDDVTSTGASLRAALNLLEAANLAPIGLAVTMLQTTRWQATLPTLPLAAAFATPLFTRDGTGWTAAP